MARRSKQLVKSTKFDTISPEVEDEILAAYSEITNGQDLFVKDLPDFFQLLNIQNSLIGDIVECVEYFYSNMLPRRSVNLSRRQDYMTLNMLNYYTISSQVKTIDDIIDIIDIDKLIKQTNKLIQFRNNHSFIVANWKLFTNQLNIVENIEFYKLTLPDLKTIKTALNLDQGGTVSLSDSLLIDMLSCSFTDSKGYIINFNHDISGPCVTFKSFAYILGELGELDG